ncbi:MAG: YcaQ family DNA glycosylase [Anaerolineales bacterium]|nr:YcaQ family DNA glycosylase [Anaerolineales bacterium]
MNPITLSKSAARRIMLDAQLLHGPPGMASGTDGASRIIERLGYVQIDTIHVVERAHHHVLWTRMPGYGGELLHELQAVRRGVFEYWARAMAYLPMRDYRFSILRMRQFRRPDHPRRTWIEARQKLPLETVMNRIRAEGPLSAKDFAHPRERKRGPWWDWKPAKSALELLLWQGELMVAERRNFQKVYDLTERVLPSGTDTRLPDERETAEHLIRRALGAMGIAEAREIDEYLQPAAARDSVFRVVSWDRLTRTIDELAEDGAVVPVLVEGDREKTHYALSGAAERSAGTPKAKAAVRLLSPFDNLVIQRDRTDRFFDYQCTLECYTPAAKRIHGYFVLPVLFGERLVGRVDPQADRKSGRLILRSVELEEDFQPTGAFLAEFAKAAAAYAKFNRCNAVVLGKVRPAKWKPALRDRLKTIF